MGDTNEEENNQASGQEGSSWWGGWPGWLQTAKEKSSTALEFMKRDLSELSQVVQTDAVAAVSSTAAMLKEKLMVDNVETVAIKARDSVSSFLEVLSDVFVPMKEIEDYENAEAYVIKNSEPVILDWWQAQLHNIRRDPKTYCHEPEGPPEMYENWLESFDLDDHEEEMTNMMLESQEVQCLYDQLVPSSVSHLEFWHRYFYRVYLLKRAEAKRAEIMNQGSGDLSEEAKMGSGEVTNETVLTESRNSILDGTNICNKQRADNRDMASSSETLHNSLTMSSNQLDSRTLFETNSVQNSDLVKDPVITSTVKACKTSLVNNPTDQESLLNSQTVDSVLKDNELKNRLKREIADICSGGSEASTPGKHSPIEVITDENRSTPSDITSKEYSTGDEWEKDFDLEVSAEDTKERQTDSLAQELKVKEGDDDWEKW